MLCVAAAVVDCKRIIRKDALIMSERKTKISSAVKNRYNAKAYDRITLIVKKGDKDIIKQRAAALGVSVNEYITKMIYSDLNREDCPLCFLYLQSAPGSRYNTPHPTQSLCTPTGIVQTSLCRCPYISKVQLTRPLRGATLQIVYTTYKAHHILGRTILL